MSLIAFRYLREACLTSDSCAANAAGALSFLHERARFFLHLSFLLQDMADASPFTRRLVFFALNTRAFSKFTAGQPLRMLLVARPVDKSACACISRKNQTAGDILFLVLLLSCVGMFGDTRPTGARFAAATYRACALRIDERHRPHLPHPGIEIQERRESCKSTR